MTADAVHLIICFLLKIPTQMRKHVLVVPPFLVDGGFSSMRAANFDMREWLTRCGRFNNIPWAELIFRFKVVLWPIRVDEHFSLVVTYNIPALAEWLSAKNEDPTILQDRAIRTVRAFHFDSGNSHDELRHVPFALARIYEMRFPQGANDWINLKDKFYEVVLRIKVDCYQQQLEDCGMWTAYHAFLALRLVKFCPMQKCSYWGEYTPFQDAFNWLSDTQTYDEFKRSMQQWATYFLTLAPGTRINVPKNGVVSVLNSEANYISNDHLQELEIETPG